MLVTYSSSLVLCLQVGSVSPHICLGAVRPPPVAQSALQIWLSLASYDTAIQIVQEKERESAVLFKMRKDGLQSVLSTSACSFRPKLT